MNGPQRASVVWAVMSAALCLTVAALWLRGGSSGWFSPTATSPGPSPQDPALRAVLEGMTIPEFELIGPDGNGVGRSVFEGRWTILGFMFSHCTMACPVLSQNMLGLTQSLADVPVRFVSISVDPVHDTPLRLAEYALELGADRSRWTFLTAAGSRDPGVVRSIAVEGLGFELADDPANVIDLGGGASMNNIAHPTRFLIIGPDVRVRGMYQGNDQEDLRALERDLRRMLKRDA